MSRTVLLIIGIVVAALCLCGIGGAVLFGGAIFGATQPAADKAEEFLVNLRDSRYGVAYELMTPGLQARFPNGAAMGQQIEQARVKPQSWTLNNRSVNNNEAVISGTANFVGGGTGTVRVTLVNEGGRWLVDGFNLSPN